MSVEFEEQHVVRTARSNREGSITSLLIENKIVDSPEKANRVLIGLTVLFFALALFILLT
jgi:hypothetical protein